MKRPFLVLLASLAAAAASAQTQGRPPVPPSGAAVRPAPPEPRLQTEFRLGGMVMDNFFQAPDGAVEEDEAAATAEARVSWRLSERGHDRVFAGIDQASYTDFGTARGLTAGWERDGRRQDALVSANMDWNRPAFDVGEVLGTADVRGLSGRWSVRLADDWEPGLFAAWQHEDYDLADFKDNDFRWIGASLRYRGFGRRFSPEIGISRGGRDAVDDNEDHDQREWYVRVRSALARNVNASIRYRRRARDYDAVAGSNALREDRRGQVALSGDWFFHPHVGAGLYYTWEDAESTRAERTFDAQGLSLTLIVRP